MTGYRITANDFSLFALSAEHVAMLTMKFRDLKEGAKDVHNWAARGLLTYQPKTEQVRQPRYSFATAIEVACVSELTRAGYGVKQAAQIAKIALDHAKHLAATKPDDAADDNALQGLKWNYGDGPLIVFWFKPDGDVQHDYRPRSATLADLYPQEFGQVLSPFNRHLFDAEYLIWTVCDRYADLMAERAQDPTFFNALSAPSRAGKRSQ